ncbi:MAG: ATP-binding cassette domain-containing protein [Acidobacteria bacterium]|nr:ATP-binding cassette domain-containing protein [Acidobacteriota bacterium]
MIEIDQLRKLYGEHEALRGISFRVHQGEILGFLGPNGAGKSTTMKIMTGLTPPTSGTARIAGHDVLEEPLEVRRAIGFLPEVPPLYPEMVVEDYLRFAAEIRSVPRARRGKALQAALERCGLTEVRKRLVGNLSKGYRQRVGLAQAVIHEPRILILDEPTVGLDPTQVIEIRSIIRQLGQERTVILSSHILPEVQATCQRVVIINRGRMVAEGDIGELLHSRGAGRLLVTLRRPPEDPRALAAIPGVQRVERVDESRLRVDLSPEPDTRERFVRELATGPYGLLEVISETTTLEEVFRDVVLQEAAP